MSETHGCLVTLASVVLAAARQHRVVSQEMLIFNDIHVDQQPQARQGLNLIGVRTVSYHIFIYNVNYNGVIQFGPKTGLALLQDT